MIGIEWITVENTENKNVETYKCRKQSESKMKKIILFCLIDSNENFNFFLVFN